LYVGSWIGLTLARTRDRDALRVWFSGLSEGVRTAPAQRRPMKWRTAWRLTRAGRPPVV
jgi:hypothetical protein